MKLTLVTYAKTFNLGNYCSEKIGLEASIDDSESPESALAILKEIVTKFHEQNNPQLETTVWTAPTPLVALPETQVQKTELSIDEVKEITDAMDAATDITAFEKEFNFLQKQHPVLGASFSKNAARLLSPK